MAESIDMSGYAGGWQINAPDSPLGTWVEIDQTGAGQTNTHVDVQLGSAAEEPHLVHAAFERTHPPLRGLVVFVVDGPVPPERPDLMSGTGSFSKNQGEPYSAEIKFMR